MTSEYIPNLGTACRPCRSPPKTVTRSPEFSSVLSPWRERVGSDDRSGCVGKEIRVNGEEGGHQCPSPHPVTWSSDRPGW